MQKKPWRNALEGNTGIATKRRSPAAVIEMNSDEESSETSNAFSPIIRSKISRGASIPTNSRSMPSGATSPDLSASMRS